MEYVQFTDDQFVALTAGAALLLGMLITLWDGYYNDSENYPKR